MPTRNAELELRQRRERNAEARQRREELARVERESAREAQLISDVFRFGLREVTV